MFILFLLKYYEAQRKPDGWLDDDLAVKTELK